MATSLIGLAQVTDTIGQDEKANLHIKNADSFTWDYTQEEPVQQLRGNVKIYQDSIFMFSDYAYVVKNDYLTAIGNVIIIQEDTIRVFSDSLIYNGALKESQLFGNVALQNGEQELFTNVLYYDLNSKIADFPDTMFMQNKKTKLNSLEGTFWLDKNEAIFRKKVVVQDSAFNLYADSLLYNTSSDIASFISPTKIIQEGKEIYCEDGYYNLNTGEALFTQNAKYVEGTTKADANEIRYSEKKKEVMLSGNAHYRGEDKIADADTIIFNEESEDITLLGNGYYEGDGKVVQGDKISFNQKTGKLEVEGKSFLSEPPMIIEGEKILYDSISGYADFYGDVIWRDTSTKNTIYSEFLSYNSETEIVRVEKKDGVRPMLLQILDGDSLYLSADTLLFNKIKTDTAEYQSFTAFPDVRIFKENMKAVSDHFYFDDLDSTFTLTGIPIMWSDSSQFSGDTIHIFLEEGEIDRMKLKQNTFIVNSASHNYYNQISGTEANADFLEDYVETMLVHGNSRSIYFLKDEIGAFIGTNKTDCSRMRFYFKKDSLTDVRFYADPAHQLTPVNQATEKELYLEGFSWQINLKPSSVEDILDTSKVMTRTANQIAQDGSKGSEAANPPGGAKAKGTNTKTKPSQSPPKNRNSVLKPGKG